MSQNKGKLQPHSICLGGHEHELTFSSMPVTILRLETTPQLFREAPSHQHLSYVIIWITQGTGMHSISAIDYSIRPNTLFFLAPGSLHAMRLGPLTMGFVIIFTSEFLASSTQEAHKSSLSSSRARYRQSFMLHLSEKEAGSMIHVMCCMERELQGNLSGQQEMIRAYFQLLLTTISREGSGYTPGTFPPISPLLQSFADLVEMHFRHKHHVHEYAELLCITPGYLNEAVKQSLGKTAHEVIHERILLEAKHMLAYSEMPIADIAAYLHFQDVAYFQKFFKSYVQQTPHGYRKSIVQQRT